MKTAIATILAVICAAAYAGTADAKVSASGTFVQKKILKDVAVTLKSEGTWSFEKDRAFVWKTVSPYPSVFTATPTNYSFSIAGRTTVRPLEMRIEDVAQIFAIKEMKEFVEKVEPSKDNPVFSADGVQIPHFLRVLFRNGDRLEIELRK